MILYKKKSQPFLRYLFGAIILILGLTFTVADVYGFQMSFGQNSYNSYTDSQQKNYESTNNYSNDNIIIDISTETYNDQSQTTDTVPTSVPEPSTIFLLASGLGLLGIVNRKNK